jgi:Family of unknown function (DUF6335)
MKRMTTHTTRAHGKPLTFARRVAHPRAAGVLDRDAGDVVEMSLAPALTTVLTGGDIDADWMRAWDSGDEAVGGSAATPDQDIVDEIGRALGVEQEADAEVWTSREILRERDRHRWEQED